MMGFGSRERLLTAQHKFTLDVARFLPFVAQTVPYEYRLMVGECYRIPQTDDMFRVIYQICPQIRNRVCQGILHPAGLAIDIFVFRYSQLINNPPADSKEYKYLERIGEFWESLSPVNVCGMFLPNPVYHHYMRHVQFTERKKTTERNLHNLNGGLTTDE